MLTNVFKGLDNLLWIFDRQPGHCEWKFEADFGTDLVADCSLPNRAFQISAQKADAGVAQGTT